MSTVFRHRWARGLAAIGVAAGVAAGSYGVASAASGSSTSTNSRPSLHSSMQGANPNSQGGPSGPGGPNGQAGPSGSPSNGQGASNSQNGPGQAGASGQAGPNGQGGPGGMRRPGQPPPAKVAAITSNSVTVSGQDGRTHTFNTTSSTVYKKGGDTVSRSTLVVGDVVQPRFQMTAQQGSQSGGPNGPANGGANSNTNPSANGNAPQAPNSSSSGGQQTPTATEVTILPASALNGHGAGGNRRSSGSHHFNGQRPASSGQYGNTNGQRGSRTPPVPEGSPSWGSAIY